MKNSLSLEEEFANFDFNKPLKPTPTIGEAPLGVEFKKLPSPSPGLGPKTAIPEKRSSMFGFLFSKKSHRKSQYAESRSEKTFVQPLSSPLSTPSSPSATYAPSKKKGFFARFFG